jgi:hypothetical protein
MSNLSQDQIDARIAKGHEQAREQSASEHKPFGQTTDEVYPFTYWWIVGYNTYVDEQAATPPKAKKAAK